jgi:hypothetical protein
MEQILACRAYSWSSEILVRWVIPSFRSTATFMKGSYVSLYRERVKFE